MLLLLRKTVQEKEWIMGIKGTEKMGSWGKKVPVNDDVHITQTNKSSDDGPGAHVTTEDSDTGEKARDYFDSDGNHTRSTVKPR